MERGRISILGFICRSFISFIKSFFAPPAAGSLGLLECCFVLFLGLLFLLCKVLLNFKSYIFLKLHVIEYMLLYNHTPH